MIRFSKSNHLYWSSLILILAAIVDVDYNNGYFVKSFLLLPSMKEVPSFQRGYAMLRISSPLTLSSWSLDSRSKASDDDILKGSINSDETTSAAGGDNTKNNNNTVTMSVDSNHTDESDDISSNTRNGSESSNLPFVAERPIMVTGDQVGIGGKDGARPDVNKLKRNLVQESVQKYKKELLTLLGTPSLLMKRQQNSLKNRGHTMEEKLAALLEINPVTTTTDSNILDGLWEFTLVVETTPAILNSLRYVWKGGKSAANVASNNIKNNNKNTNKLPSGMKQLGSPYRLKNQKMENPFRESKREINLENLSDEEDPYVLDCTSYFNGLIRVETLYKVVGLTRTSLDMAVESRTTYIMDKEIKQKDSDKFMGMSIPMNIVYLDTDLYIATGNSHTYNDDMTNKSKNNNKDWIAPPLHVYTKSHLWRSSRKERHFAAMIAWIMSIQSPLRLRQRIRNRFFAKRHLATDVRGPLTDKEKAELLRKIYYSQNNNSSSMTISRVGDLADNLEDDNLAWNGDEDPFVHLSATERQDLLRSMSIQEIEEAWKRQQKLSKKKRSRATSKKFQKPNN